ncbi:MAG: hypothetical protein K0Q49_163 [Haloplasmataceae bacterium]|jgi:YhcH/YjgK/YiaL family protein|nr:hypothetical protein [Haloplasmataceae bacterium]
MIIGRELKELRNYYGHSKNLDFAIDFILGNDLITFGVGKQELLGKEVTLSVEEYEPRDIEQCYFENHHKYLDIQIVLSGKEGFGYANVNNKDLQVTNAYNADKDIAKYALKPEFIFEMQTNSFAVVYPEDLHMPKIKLADSLQVKKAIFKVKL